MPPRECSGAINIVKTKFRGDNYLGSKPWELGYTGVDHNGKFFRIRKPADVKAMGEAQNKFAQFIFPLDRGRNFAPRARTWDGLTL